MKVVSMLTLMHGNYTSFQVTDKLVDWCDSDKLLRNMVTPFENFKNVTVRN